MAAVLLNGVRGRWLAVRNDLRQRDPASPYLFLLVANVLQHMIRQDEVLRHPVVDGVPPVVLQYADDMLIIFLVDPAAVMARLRIILDLFVAATGLVINFSKSSLVPMYVDPEVLAAVVGSFQCSVDSFP
ncbi:hypothetical protein D1007_09828 [Hordeum vulgare]|nr:hypothetical protein D1007_09828 [Hordeum vulgare]